MAISRSIALDKMGWSELMRWIRDLTIKWNEEYSELSTGLPELEREIIRSAKELVRRDFSSQKAEFKHKESPHGS